MEPLPYLSSTREGPPQRKYTLATTFCPQTMSIRTFRAKPLIRRVAGGPYVFPLFRLERWSAFPICFSGSSLSNRLFRMLGGKKAVQNEYRLCFKEFGRS